jgi:hypothetical protein
VVVTTKKIVSTNNEKAAWDGSFFLLLLDLYRQEYITLQYGFYNFKKATYLKSFLS